MKKILISFLTLLSLSSINAQTTKKVCFLGNSYTYVNDMPGLVSSLATAEGNTLIKDQNTPGGYTLSGHSTNATSLAKITSNTWDYVVLQDQSQGPSFPYGQVTVDVYPKAVILSDSIRSANECAIPLFFNTWGREVGDPQWDSINTFKKMNNRLFNAYDYMANVNNAKLAPVGIGFRHVLDAASTVVTHADLYSGDGSHPSIYGSYLTACVFYNVIFETTPVGNSFLPNGITQNQATYLQNVAYHVVNDVDSVTVNYSDDPVVDFSFVNSNLSFDFTNLSQNGTSYSWSFGDGSISEEENPTHIYTINGAYNVSLTVTNENTNCNFESQKLITIDLIGLELGEHTNSKFKVFPNPSNTVVNILTTDFVNEITVFNLQGQIQVKFIPTTSKFSFDLPKGLYLIKQGTLIQKVIVE